MQCDIKDEIVTFARHLGKPDANPERLARARDWLGPDGQPTEDGHALVTALRDQDGTRSTFRYI